MIYKHATFMYHLKKGLLCCPVSVPHKVDRALVLVGPVMAKESVHVPLESTVVEKVSKSKRIWQIPGIVCNILW